jgi:hypothetical protein
MGINNLDGRNEKGGDPLLLIFVALFILLLIVTIGTIGYRIYGRIAWIDAFHNAAMVLTSTSLVTPVTDYDAKIFSAFYNLMSGIFVLVIIGVVIRKSLTLSGISDVPDNDNDNGNAR